MPHFWLRVAVLLYGVGLLYALIAVTGRREIMARIILPALGLATVFHFVSLVEAVAASGHLAPVVVYQYESLLALLLMLFFFGVYWRYKTTSHGIFVFPVVFLLTLTASLGQQPPVFDGSLKGIYVALRLLGNGRKIGGRRKKQRTAVAGIVQRLEARLRSFYEQVTEP